MKFNFPCLAFVFGLMASFGCAPDLPEDVTTLDVVYTNFNPDFDFAQGTTFAIPENVVIVTETPIQPGQQPPFIDFVAGRSILGAIRANMLARGFTQVNQFANPDYILLPTVPESNSLIFNYNWWFWDWWIPNLGAGLGWIYPGYQPAVVSSVSTGSLLIQLVNMKSVNASNQLEVDWVVIVNGALTGSQTSNTERAVAGINQAFIQSPYIQK
ncbi:DUF4136 domain-containing protein [Cognataquiflexum rubidum]|uniref:DUF4136 domain-containing protein n=1 Tax=Cognataquiflexum rubidum TaxID=2922273 RepID=UPI001F12C557|nr:DUF4136 domain-containing protein [Cognataquiflexum rubidum]MCH6233621.1 DUF4136 domain-containing protein [Cognataquiflexum rubidum]